MKIAIIGTRGIPNNYSGFEQFAEYFSAFMAEKGYDITVYNSHNHSYQESEFKGVKIRHKWDPEYLVGTFGQFIYDFNCIMDARNKNYDIILQLGYTSSSVWYFLMPKNATILTNMDGLEWKRTKYSFLVQKFLKFAEMLAARKSHFLIADSLGIKEYIHKKYNLHSTYIPYGAHEVKLFNKSILEEFNLKPKSYNMLIARMEPENNIEIIIKGALTANNKISLLIVGNYNGTKFGKYLFKEYNKYDKIKFLGGIFDINKLNSLRFFSNLYFHGHSVGGTNPSLLEAMASKALIIAHKNDFNASILNKDAFYFENSSDVANFIDNIKKLEFMHFVENNFLKIKEKYNWEIVNQAYLKLIKLANDNY